MTKVNAESDADEQGGIACLRNDPMTKPFTMKCFGKLLQLTLPRTVVLPKSMTVLLAMASLGPPLQEPDLGRSAGARGSGSSRQ